MIILGLVFVALMTIGVPISFSVGVASVVPTPLLPLLACMLLVLLAVTYLPEMYWWLPRSFGLVK